jgi:hypothetical protein
MLSESQVIGIWEAASVIAAKIADTNFMSQNQKTASIYAQTVIA